MSYSLPTRLPIWQRDMIADVVCPCNHRFFNVCTRPPFSEVNNICKFYLKSLGKISFENQRVFLSVVLVDVGCNENGGNNFKVNEY